MSKFTLRAVMTFGLLMMLWMNAFSQNSSLSGKVVDDKGEIVIGATIVIKGSPISTATNQNGEYTINQVPLGKTTVTVNMIGYSSMDLPIQIVSGANVLNFNLNSSTNDLEEVVVIGYGVAKKKQITGSISSVGPKEFNTGVVSSPDQLLAGKVAGLTVNRSGGDPTAGSTIQLRGPSSLTASSSPLYVIDGVVGANIELVAPDDIVSMDVMKDASSTAIYGSRAANGVIFVTTKRGKAGKPVLSYSGYAAIERVANRVNVLSAAEHKQFVADNGLTVAASETGFDTDWQDEITRTGVSHNHNLSLTGGSEGTRYNASVNYFNNQGIVKRSDLERVVARVGIDQNAFDDRLKLALNVANSMNKSNHVDYGIFNGAARYLPTSPVRSDDVAYAPYNGY